MIKYFNNFWHSNFNKHRIHRINCFLLIIFLCNNGLAQETGFSISLSAGITWRSPALNHNNLRPVRIIDFQTSFVGEKNIQGLSYNPGVRFNFRNVGLEYYPNLRYDVVSSDRSNPTLSNRYIKEFIVDHNMNFFIRKKVTYGLGMSIVNTGKNISYSIQNQHYNPSIQFATINCFLSKPIKDFIDVEFKLHFIPNGYHGYDSVQALLGTIRVYKEFSSLFDRKHN